MYRPFREARITENAHKMRIFAIHCNVNLLKTCLILLEARKAQYLGTYRECDMKHSEAAQRSRVREINCTGHLEASW